MMLRLWQWLKRWGAQPETVAPAVPSLLPLPHAPEWQPQNKAEWISFLATPTGMILRQRLYAAAAENARNGATDAMHSAHSAGRSTGFYDAILWLESQARIEFEQQIPISGASSELGATSAQEHQGDALLRELYSP